MLFNVFLSINEDEKPWKSQGRKIKKKDREKSTKTH